MSIYPAKFWSFLSSPLFLLSLCCLPYLSNAQNIKQAKKMDKKIIKKLFPEEKEIIQQLKNALINYQWARIQPLFHPDHYDGQMDMYLNDNFMFAHFGPVGKRDTAAIQQFYLHEVFGIAVEAEDEWMPKGSSFRNFFNLEDLSSIKNIYLIQTDMLGDLKRFHFYAITTDGHHYIGKIWLADSLWGLRACGSSG